MVARYACMLFTVLGLSLGAPGQAVPVSGHQLMASAPSPHAIQAAQAALAAGGNVADVAVVIGLTLAVTSPYFAALGGGGFAMIKMGEKVEALDFREMAPSGTHPQFFLDRPENASLIGGAAVGVPGVPAGLWALHQKHGKLPWRRLFEWPLKLAQEGFAVSGEWVENTVEEKNNFNPSGRKHLFKKDGSALRPGEVLKQVPLAQALLELRNHDIKGFYQGSVARDVVQAVHESGGVLTVEDMAKYQVRWLTPILAEFQGHRLHLMPPPSSGGVVLKTAFALAEKANLNRQTLMSAEELHLMGEILKRAFRGRALLGDPDYHQNPLTHLLSPDYFKELLSSIKLDRATSLPALKDEAKPESSQTTHFSVMDNKGNAVALTVTLNGNYGSRLLSPRYGIALNNQMDDFTTRPGHGNLYGLVQGAGNQVQPGKRPLSSMSPTIVEKNGTTVMAIGAPGGPRIISSVFQVLYRRLVNGLDLDLAIQTPRIHHQFLPDKLYVDQNRWAPETLSALKKRGHGVEPSWMGKVYAVELSREGLLHGAFDSRGEGAAGGK